jgi:hypothetical protein
LTNPATRPIASDAAMGRALGVGLALLLAATVVPPWLGLVLGVAVRAFRLAAGG